MSVNGSQNVHYLESWDGMGRSGSKVDLECNGRIASSSWMNEIFRKIPKGISSGWLRSGGYFTASSQSQQRRETGKVF